MTMCKCEKKKGTGMRKVKEVLRLHNEYGNLSFRQIAASCNLSATTVGKIICNAKTLGVGWPLPLEIDYDQLRRKLLGIADKPVAGLEKLQNGRDEFVDLADVSRELSRKGVTLKLLWEEYQQSGCLPYSYSHFCALYNQWKKRHSESSCRFEHKAGEKLFVDWAGQKISYQENGEKREACLFVGVLGASNYTYASVFRDMKLSNWIAAHEEALNYFGGVTEIVVPDNTKTAVIKSCKYDPDLNPTYREFAEHYGMVVMPARSGKPKDKAKVEQGVQMSERWILAALRNHQFLSFGQLKEAVKEKLNELNQRPFSKMDGNRHSLFLELEKNVLKPLPVSKFQFGDWLTAKVHRDYHIQADKHFYSVPYQYKDHEVGVLLRKDRVEIYYNEERIAFHQRSFLKGKATTDKNHMPPKDYFYTTQSVNDIKERAGQIGQNCLLAVIRLLETMPRPEMAFRSCYGILRLGKKYSSARLEKACFRACELDMCNYRTINNMLANAMEDESLPFLATKSIRHGNIRGKNYYRQNGGQNHGG